MAETDEQDGLHGVSGVFACTGAVYLFYRRGLLLHFSHLDYKNYVLVHANTAQVMSNQHSSTDWKWHQLV